MLIADLSLPLFKGSLLKTPQLRSPDHTPHSFIRLFLIRAGRLLFSDRFDHLVFGLYCLAPFI